MFCMGISSKAMASNGPNLGADGVAGIGASTPQPSALEGESSSSSSHGPGHCVILPNSLVPPGGLRNLFNRGGRPEKKVKRGKREIGKLIRGKRKVLTETDALRCTRIHCRRRFRGELYWYLW